MIVVDANVVAYFWLRDPLSGLAEQGYRKDPEWAVPVLWRSEFCNVLTAYLRKKLLSPVEARDAFKRAELILSKREYGVSIEEIIPLVTTSACSSYDCEYVALAKRLGVKLVTKDAKLIKEFPKVVIDLEVFAKP